MRAPRQGGDVLTIGTVAGGSTKPYPLAPVAQNISYETVSDQPEAQPNQHLAWPLSFHGGLSDSTYEPHSAGCVQSDGLLVHTPNIIRPTPKPLEITLTGAANPPMYFFEADVNDSGADEGRPRLYAIACEAAEINVYKLSLAYGLTATGTGVTTDDTAKTLTDARQAWTTNEWVGEIVTCNSQTLTVTSNTATVLTGTGGWSSDPGDGHAYKIGVGDFGTLLSTETLSLTPTQPMGRPALWYDGTNTQWRVPTGDSTNDMQSLTAIASGTGNDTWEPTDSGTCDADARHLFVVGEKLYRTTGNNEVSVLPRNTDPTTEANWGDEFYVGSDATKITDIGEAGGLCYIAKEDGFYEWDGEGTADNVLPEIGYAPRNGQGMIYWHGGFLIPTASGLWWTRTGQPVGPDSNPNNSQNHPSLPAANASKGGRWMGLSSFGAYVFGIYVTPTGGLSLLCWGRERHDADPPGWGPLIWHILAQPAADHDDFHGCFVTETSERSLADTSPYIWYAAGNSVSGKPLDKEGAPRLTRGQISVADSWVYSGDIDFGCPRVLKQLWKIDGWADDINTDHLFRFRVARDGGALATVGSDITSDGYFEQFWTQDSADTARSFLTYCKFEESSNSENQNGPHLRDVMLHAVALPDTTNVWTFLVAAEEETMRTAKLIRTEMEAYKNDLLKFEMPDGDSFNGVLTGIRMLRANEVRELAVDRDDKGKALPIPKYTIAVTVREMVSA